MQPHSDGVGTEFHFTLHLDWFPTQFCRLLESLAGHYIEHWVGAVQEASPVLRPVSCIPLPMMLSPRGKALPGGPAAVDGASSGKTPARRQLADGEITVVLSDSVSPEL